MMIRAGLASEITPTSGNWLILDIGFANAKRSCCLMVGKAAPIAYSFGEMKETICQIVRESKEPVNLVVEAPLSVAFDKYNNPKGRRVEMSGSKRRYWYLQTGVVVMVASLYLIDALKAVEPSSEVRLFEGLVSFKKAGAKSNHINDVRLLREVVDNPAEFRDSILEPKDLRIDESDTLTSAFTLAGLDIDVPPVILRNAQDRITVTCS